MGAHLKIYEMARLAGRTVFFDANILIYLFWPTGRQSCEKDYAHFLGACLKNRIPLAVDFLVISEAINRILRIEYERHCANSGIAKTQLPFKAYRDSADGRQTQSDVYAVLKRHLAAFSIVGKAYSSADVLGFLAVDRLDIVDKAIAALCAENRYVLATHDSDFSASSLDIVSANPAF